MHTLFNALSHQFQTIKRNITLLLSCLPDIVIRIVGEFSERFLFRDLVLKEFLKIILL